MSVLEDVLNFINCSRFFFKSLQRRGFHNLEDLFQIIVIYMHVPTLDQIDATIQNVHILIQV